METSENLNDGILVGKFKIDLIVWKHSSAEVGFVAFTTSLKLT